MVIYGGCGHVKIQIGVVVPVTFTGAVAFGLDAVAAILGV
jgi:hypothetical protein